MNGFLTQTKRNRLIHTSEHLTVRPRTSTLYACSTFPPPAANRFGFIGDRLRLPAQAASQLERNEVNRRLQAERAHGRRYRDVSRRAARVTRRDSTPTRKLSAARAAGCTSRCKKASGSGHAYSVSCQGAVRRRTRPARRSSRRCGRSAMQWRATVHRSSERTPRRAGRRNARRPELRRGPSARFWLPRDMVDQRVRCYREVD